MAPVSNRDDDFVFTISDDDNFPPEDEELDFSPADPPSNSTKRKRSQEPTTNGPNRTAKKQKNSRSLTHNAKDESDVAGQEDGWTAHGEDDGALDSDFEFQVGEGDGGVLEDFNAWDVGGEQQIRSARGDKKGVDIDSLIARRRKEVEKGQDQDVDGGEAAESTDSKDDSDEEPDRQVQNSHGESEEEDKDETMAPDGFGMGATGSDEEGEIAQRPEESSNEASENDLEAEPVPHPDDEALDASSDSEDDDAEEKARRDAFFAPEEPPESTSNAKSSSNSFQTMSLSRPILRGLASCAFTTPTPIQSKTIPVALLGRDVVGGAVTGSGKTAAFIIPILERLLYRPKKIPTSRVAILMPTRELAVQCHTVARKLASFTNITIALIVGGLSLREQETTLRTRPDMIIATPGRFIDHMRNSPSFTLSTLEILVLDEADRMLDDGFADELNEILTSIPRSRQTMLFSATMTTRVESLIRLSLNHPIRLVINPPKRTVTTLTQEFVRLRPGREDKRLAYLIHLCRTTYTSQTIIFFRQKALAHRIRVLFSLLDLRAAELHGSMTQEQRLASLTAFRSGTAHFLLATDVASRGLDIPNVSTVVNYTAPQNATIYLHRVGRTARAGRAGRACTLAAEPDRKVVKEIVKAAKAQNAKIVSRTVDADIVDTLHTELEALEPEIDAILKEEKAERALQGVEMQIQKGDNLMRHEEEIKARPKRTWFESEREKVVAKKKGFEELNGVVGKEKKKGRLSGKERKRLDDGRERREGKVWKKGREERGVGKGAKGKGMEKEKGMGMGKEKQRGKVGKGKGR